MPKKRGPEHREDRQLVELWQQVLREDLRHRKDRRAIFEEHERILGRKVRQLRTERGWTQEQLAGKLNEAGWPLHQTTVAKLEAGTRPIRVAEADALALAFGLPLEALWYLPVKGEPWALARMKEHLKEMDEYIRILEDQLRSAIISYADQQAERMRLAQAINEAAKAGERGELDPGLSTEDSRAFVESMDDRGLDRAEIADFMSPEAGARHRERYGLLGRIERGEPQKVAAEAWRRYQAGESPQEIGRFIAASMPPGTREPLQEALDIIRESIGPSGDYPDPLA